jgi:signal transduction histidine kinase
VRRAEATEEELLNRIAAIQAAAEILDDHSGLSHDDRQVFVNVIRTETERMHALVRQIAQLFPDCMRRVVTA